MKRISYIQLITASLILMLTLLILFTVFIDHGLSSQYDSQRKRTEIIGNIQSMKETISIAVDSISKYLSSGSIYKLSDYFEAISEAEDIVSNLHTLQTDNDESLYVLQSLSTSLASFEEECDQAFNKYTSNDMSFYVNRAKTERIAYYMSQYCDRMLRDVLDEDIVHLNSSLQTFQRIEVISVVAIILFIVVILLIIYIFYSKLTRPLLFLASEARRISDGDLSPVAPVKEGDAAVVLLSSTFSNMVDDINMMMEDIRKKVDAEQRLLEEKRKNIEYQAMLDRATFLSLQAQTNPHFLYNTLNTISRTITLGKPEIAKRMLSSLATLMRYNLSDGSIPAILSEEIEITKEYLDIQKLRFEDRLAYSIDIPDEILDTVQLPRFTLQPLVENAMIHGIQDREADCKVLISGKKRGNEIVIRIADNGRGMSKERLDEVIRGKTGRVGVSNTRRRLEIFFSDDSCFEMISQEGVGTMIITHIRKVDDV